MTDMLYRPIHYICQRKKKKARVGYDDLEMKHLWTLGDWMEHEMKSNIRNMQRLLIESVSQDVFAFNGISDCNNFVICELGSK